MKIAIPVVCVAFALSGSSVVQAEAPGSVTLNRMSSGSLGPVDRSKVATELLKKPVQTGPAISLTWYHMIDTPVYTMAALQPFVVGYDVVKQKPFARLEPTSSINLSVNKVDTKARTYFVDCIVDDQKGGAQVKWHVHDSIDPSVNDAEGMQAPQVVGGVQHVSFVLSKPKTASFVDLVFTPTGGDFYVYQCDIAPVL